MKSFSHLVLLNKDEETIEGVLSKMETECTGKGVCLESDET